MSLDYYKLIFAYPIRILGYFMLSEDLGSTSFNNEIKGSELSRWISKAIDKEEFIKIV